MAWRRFLALVGVLAAICPAQAAERALVLNTGTLSPYTEKDESGFLDRLVREAFRRVGREARVFVYDRASERAILNAAQGIDDGIAMRIEGLDRKYPNLVRIPEKVIDNDFVALSAAPDIRVASFADLAARPVGYILGWQVFDRNLPPGGDVTQVKSAEQLFGLLAMGRVEVVLYERWQGLRRARDMGLPVQVHEPPLVRQEMFMYLHDRHRHLAEPVAAALRAMKDDGAYAVLVERTLAPLAAQ